MQDLPTALERVSRLCTTLGQDKDLRGKLQDAGFPAKAWESVAGALRDGVTVERLNFLLDAVEDAAAKAGLDGLTIASREYQALPSASPGYRTVSGWRCPHPRRCGRVVTDADAKVAPVCALNGSPLEMVTVTSG